MKLNQLILPAVALGLGAAVFLPGKDATAYALSGFTLNQGQRDFRIYNNFTDTQANNNQTPDPNFPGAQGAVMAIWKGCVEWQSVLHGDGDGDPHQPFGLGSGGANFDPSYQGEATGVGGLNDNIHSEINGSQGGTLAYTESPDSSGWRIRYLSTWTWNDGPNTGIPLNHVDLQGVAVHEYGHALGLGHSGVNGATMRPSIAGSGVGARSINHDDQAGVQAAYGVIDLNKPEITNVEISGSTIEIMGFNFDAQDNEIWFTQAGAGGTGNPIKVAGLSSNGTELSAAIPGGAGPGDVLVRRDGGGHIHLSNAWPTDLVDASCPPPANYCSGLPNSAGPGATLSYSGSTSIATNDLMITCSGAPSNKPGIFFYGDAQNSLPFGEGLLCAVTDIKRLGVQFTDALGTVTRHMDVTVMPFSSGSGQALPGETHNFQFWYRDTAGGPAGYNTSDGLEVVWCD